LYWFRTKEPVQASVVGHFSVAGVFSRTPYRISPRPRSRGEPKSRRGGGRLRRLRGARAGARAGAMSKVRANGTEKNSSFFSGFGRKKKDKPQYDGEWKNGKANGKVSRMAPLPSTRSHADVRSLRTHRARPPVPGEASASCGRRPESCVCILQGSCTWPNGDTYSGDWKDNRMHGRGVFVWKLKSCRYDGEVWLLLPSLGCACSNSRPKSKLIAHPGCSTEMGCRTGKGR